MLICDLMESHNVPELLNQFPIPSNLLGGPSFSMYGLVKSVEKVEARDAEDRNIVYFKVKFDFHRGANYTLLIHSSATRTIFAKLKRGKRYFVSGYVNSTPNGIFLAARWWYSLEKHPEAAKELAKLMPKYQRGITS
jgi:hypothetical protein